MMRNILLPTVPTRALTPKMNNATQSVVLNPMRSSDDRLGVVSGFHKPADIVTCPVLYRPMARAAAGDRSMSLPRTQGPRSLTRTVTHPLWQTRIWVPNGSLRWAAVIAAQFSGFSARGLVAAETVASAIDARYFRMRS